MRRVPLHHRPGPAYTDNHVDKVFNQGESMSSAPLEQDRGGSYSIPEVVALAERGILRIPTFQRQYVWDSQDVRDLFDSIYRGFPIGTLLLWRRRAPTGTVHFGPIAIDADATDSALWVVDGQQRVTSLFGTLSSRTKGVDPRFEIYFDLGKQRFISPVRGVPPTRSVPVREALETRRLLSWLRAHADELEPEDFDLADGLGGALRDYKMPSYTVAGEDQSVLREVFDRVNSAGKPISRAQIFHALFAGDEQASSPSAVSDSLSRLGFGRIDESRIVQSLLAIRGGDVQRDLHGEFSPDEDPEEWYQFTDQALARSIDFLRSEGVPHSLLMPNTLPVPVLAAFFHLHPRPDPWTLTLLSRWLWRGWIHGFGREGGQTPVLRRAIQSVNPRSINGAPSPSEDDAAQALLAFAPDREAPDLVDGPFNTKYANPRLVALSMANAQPLDLWSEPIDLAFQFEQHGSDAITELVPKARRRAAARGFWRHDDLIPVSHVKDENVLRSHVISPLAAELLKAADVEGFLRERTETLRTVTRSFLQSRLDVGGRPRASIARLVEKAASGSLRNE